MPDSDPSLHGQSSLDVGQVTQLIDAIGSGQAKAEQLLPMVYDELRRLAAQRLSNEPSGQTLQPTALVHEAYLRLLGPDASSHRAPDGSSLCDADGYPQDASDGSFQGNSVPRVETGQQQETGAKRHETDLAGEIDPPGLRLQWDSRGHFFAAAAEAMRRILVENARRKGRIKHGGQFQRVNLLDADRCATTEPDDSDGLLALDQALEAFAQASPDKAQLVKLRYFAGLSEADAADLLGISRATASRWWAFSRAWLYDRLGNDSSSKHPES